MEQRRGLPYSFQNRRRLNKLSESIVVKWIQKSKSWKMLSNFYFDLGKIQH